MTTTKRRRNRTDGESKESIHKNFLATNPKHLTDKDTYFDIVERLHRKMFDVMCERKYSVRVSPILGSFYITAYVPVKEKHKVIDFKLSNELGKKVYFRNSHTDGKRVTIRMKRSKYTYSLNNIFRFTPAREIQRTLAKRLKNKEIPLWT